MKFQDDFFAAYRSLKLTRDADGVFMAQDHTEFVDAFYRSPRIVRTRL
jgi:hypothetical protein